ncbi:hypothetical protein ABZ446_21335 [Streptomyces sp. NPDC005813]|uniref:hypothetical protein n=1 Tax=Streptomyces sp. NPDC005813 TaxID=3155592 RepID=UPI0033F78DA0
MPGFGKDLGQGLPSTRAAEHEGALAAQRLPGSQNPARAGSGASADPDDVAVVLFTEGTALEQA